MTIILFKEMTDIVNIVFVFIEMLFTSLFECYY